jgi:hypothetical protein
MPDTGSPRIYRQKSCRGCGSPFVPTGPRSEYCGACKTGVKPAAAGDEATAASTAPGQRYVISEIRQRRRITELQVALAARQVALTRRRIAALAKMEQGIAELEQAERELEAIPEPCGTGWPG